jgi:hypothetical protein
MNKIEKESFPKKALPNINDLHNNNEYNPGLNKNLDLINISDIMELLGYSDKRSLRSFCIANKVPLFNFGKKTYTLKNFLQIIVFHQLNKNYPEVVEILKLIEAEELLKAIKAKETLKVIENHDAESTKLVDEPTYEPQRQKINLNAKNSPAAEKLRRMLDEA